MNSIDSLTLQQQLIADSRHESKIVGGRKGSSDFAFNQETFRFVMLVWIKLSPSPSDCLIYDVCVCVFVVPDGCTNGKNRSVAEIRLSSSSTLLEEVKIGIHSNPFLTLFDLADDATARF